MAETKKLYTLADILGEPITEQEAQNLIRKETNSDEQTFQNYVNLNVDNGAIFHGCNNICNDKAAIFDNLAAFAWKNLFNVYWLVKND